MEWVKNIIGMSCYWLISSRSSLFCFRFSFFVAFILFCFFCIFLLVVVLLRLCFLLYASNYSQNIFPYHCGVLFFLVSCFFVLMTLFFFVFFYILYSIFCCWRWCSPAALQSSIQVRPAIYLLRPFLSFSLYSPSFFWGCFLFWHGYSAIRTSLQFSRPNSSNDFVGLRWRFWGFALFKFI